MRFPSWGTPVLKREGSDFEKGFKMGDFEMLKWCFLRGLVLGDFSVSRLGPGFSRPGKFGGVM